MLSLTVHIRWSRAASPTPLHLPIVLLASLALAQPAAAQTRLYVDVSRPTDAGPGTSWADAYKELRTALQAAPIGGPVEIWVADGRYTPTVPAGSPEAAFQLRTGLALYGGFAGSETALSQRGLASNPTVLSGDLNGDDLPGGGGGGGGNRGDNSASVLIAVGADATAILDGFVITGGVGSSALSGNGSGSAGGGLYASGGGPTVRRCRFIGNAAGDAADPFCGAGGGNAPAGGSGGAVYALDSAPTFSDCAFIGNTAGRGGRGALCTGAGTVGTGGPGGDGGAVAVVQTVAGRPSPTFANCVFLGNAAGDGGRGGARVNGNGSNAGAGGRAGAVAVLGASAPVRFINCLFHANRAGAGGLGGTGDFGSGGDGGPGGNGGAVVVEGGAGHALLNCTLFANSAGQGGNGGTPVGVGIPGLAGLAGLRGGGFFTGSLFVDNTIARANSDRNGSATPLSQVGLSGGGGGGTLFRRSNISGIAPSPAAGTIDADPLFLNPNGPDTTPGTPDDDLRLAPSSPSADAGDNDLYRGPATDAAGKARAADSPAAPDTGVGTSAQGQPIIDMGALETAPATTTCPADFDASGTVAVPDIFAFLSAWFAGCP